MNVSFEDEGTVGLWRFRATGQHSQRQMNTRNKTQAEHAFGKWGLKFQLPNLIYFSSSTRFCLE